MHLQASSPTSGERTSSAKVGHTRSRSQLCRAVTDGEATTEQVARCASRPLFERRRGDRVGGDFSSQGHDRTSTIIRDGRYPAELQTSTGTPTRLKLRCLHACGVRCGDAGILGSAAAGVEQLTGRQVAQAQRPGQRGCTTEVERAYSLVWPTGQTTGGDRLRRGFQICRSRVVVPIRHAKMNGKTQLPTTVTTAVWPSQPKKLRRFSLEVLQ